MFFKASAFLQIFFPRNLLFWLFLNVSFSQLKTSNKRTNIPLPIDRFVSLIKLKMKRLINYWANTCIPNTITCFFPSFFRQQFCRWRCFSFYWFGKWEFGKFTNGIPLIGGPSRHAPPSLPSNLDCDLIQKKIWNLKEFRREERPMAELF